jgi:hypothetical protein
LAGSGAQQDKECSLEQVELLTVFGDDLIQKWQKKTKNIAKWRQVRAMGQFGDQDLRSIHDDRST